MYANHNLEIEIVPWEVLWVGVVERLDTNKELREIIK